MKRKHIRNFFLTFGLLTVLSVAALFVVDLYKYDKQLLISHDSGIYGESIVVSVEKYMPGNIYYTVNGDKPNHVNRDELPEGTMIYDGPLHLEMKEYTTVYSLQFYCLFSDGTMSDVYKREYILDKKGSGRFTTTYVVSLRGDEEKLFGYEEGIFVRGRQFDEYIAAHKDANVLAEIIPANYYSNAEIPVNATIFLRDGTQAVNQNCSVKIYGNITRAKNQKSFRLTARYDYDDANEFSYAFLPKLLTEEGKTAVDAYQRLAFHNAGNDNGYAFFRTELIGELARRAGFQDVVISESATVYINGIYQGVYWLENSFDDRYFKEKYGRYDGEMVICEGALSEMDLAEAKTERKKQCAEEYNAFCRWIQGADMADDEAWDRVCSVIDVENFASYMAIEYYAGNFDWPETNVKIYRYEAAEGEICEEGTVFDGKYRYLLVDTDYGMGLKFLGWYGADETLKRLKTFCEDSEDTVLFQKLMQREEFKTLFVNAVLHVMNGSFSPDEASAVLQEYNDKRWQELEYMMESTDILKNSLWEDDDNNIGNVEQELAVITKYAQNRPQIVREELRDVLGCEWGSLLTVSSDSDLHMYVNGFDVGKTHYEGQFPDNVPVEIKTEKTPGVTVTGYYVNGNFVEGEGITLMPKEWAENDTVLVEPVFETEQAESLVIAAFHIRGPEDYIVLQNNGQTMIDLSEYALSDEKNAWERGRLPGAELAPGEEFVVYGAGYTGDRLENSAGVSVSWSREEAIWLIHASGEIADCKNKGLKPR